jgi:hypothetical protein
VHFQKVRDQLCRYFFLLRHSQEKEVWFSRQHTDLFFISAWSLPKNKRNFIKDMFYPPMCNKFHIDMLCMRLSGLIAAGRFNMPDFGPSWPEVKRDRPRYYDPLI